MAKRIAKKQPSDVAEDAMRKNTSSTAAAIDGFQGRTTVAYGMTQMEKSRALEWAISAVLHPSDRAVIGTPPPQGSLT